MSWNGFLFIRASAGVMVAVALSALLGSRVLADEGDEPLRQPVGVRAAALDSADEEPRGGEDGIGEEENPDDLLDMDLDQLTQAEVVVGSSAGEMLNTEVTTVARQEVSIARTPAAVYVITQEMIRRSGARNVPEVLRRVPGLHVAQINADSWAISIRGFNSAYTDKLLVQIDGRAVYTPIFSGTYWEAQLVPLKDVERIEVIRGPGSSVWGANAVNGVINIVTKDTADTVGAYAEAGGGDEHRSFSHGRLGGWLGDSGTYRVYGMHVDDAPGRVLGAADADGRQGGQGGFRIDWRPSKQDKVTLQGDFGGVKDGSGVTGAQFSMGNLLTRWTRQVDCDTGWSVQAYYDYYDIEFDPASLVSNGVGQTVFDLDMQRHARRGRHDIVCGFGFRNYETYSYNGPGQFVDYTPDSQAFDIITYFVQDTLTLKEDFLFFTVGCKFEHSDFVGFNYQPAAKIACTPDDRTSLWGSVSRSIRTPSVSNRDSSFLSPLGGGAFLSFMGSRALQQEQAMTYELGIRRQPTDRFYWDLAGYYCRYDDLIRLTQTSVAPPFVNATLTNSGNSDTYGFEWWGTYELTEWQRLRGSYSFFRQVLEDGIQPAFNLVNAPGLYPRNMIYLGSSTDVTEQCLFDAGLRYVDAAAGVGGYVELDLRLAWASGDGVELAVVGQNLLNSNHFEFFDPNGFSATSGVQRGVFAVLSWER